MPIYVLNVVDMKGLTRKKYGGTKITESVLSYLRKPIFCFNRIESVKFREYYGLLLLSVFASCKWLFSKSHRITLYVRRGSRCHAFPYFFYLIFFESLRVNFRKFFPSSIKSIYRFHRLHSKGRDSVSTIFSTGRTRRTTIKLQE